MEQLDSEAHGSLQDLKGRWGTDAVFQIQGLLTTG